MTSASSPPPPPPPGLLYRVDGESLNSLIEKYEKSLSTNTSEQDRLEKLRQEYLTVKAKLTTLPQKLEYNALVPLGRRALCPGKIIHTNEITCLLGDNWFVECSAEKAVELVNHRIAKLDERHEGLKKERELINNWKQEAERQLVETIGEGTVEIREDYDEEYEKLWKAQHRDSVRRHHQQKAKERLEAQQEKNDNDKEMWTRLDELEIREELENYLEDESIKDEHVNNLTQPLAQENQAPSRSAKINDPGNRRVSKPDSTALRSDKKTDTKQTSFSPTVTGKRVKFSSDNIVHNISEDRGFANQESYSQEKSLTVSAPVAFTDDNTVSSYPCFEPIMLRFRHSSSIELEEEEANASGTEEEDHKHQVVASPGDIVKIFGPTSISAISNKRSPKSILKPYAPPLISDKRSKKAQSKSLSKKKPTLSFLDDDNDDNDNDNVAPIAVSNAVTERTPVLTSPELNTQGAITDESEDINVSKPVSLFKMRRQQQQQKSLGVVVTSTE